MKKNKGKLYLIPTPIADNTEMEVTTNQVRAALAGIQYFLVENVRTARRFLSSLKIYPSIEELQFSVLDKDTIESDLPDLLSPLSDGNDMGILSEAGAPAIADPGSLAVGYAHQHDIRVVPLVGSSAIMLALMASGLNGQVFAFHGYLPIPVKEAAMCIRALEQVSRATNQTQIVMDTPYRNGPMLERLLKHLHPGTHLCVALDITGSNEWVFTASVSHWRKNKRSLPKLPCLFLFHAPGA